MNHALGLTSCPGGEHHHGHIIGTKGRRRAGGYRWWPDRLGRKHRALETRVAGPIDDDQMLQMMQFAAHALGHRGIVKSPIYLGDNEDLGFAEIQNIEQLALAKYRHYGIENGANLAASQRRDYKLPPIRQLDCHHVARADSQSV